MPTCITMTIGASGVKVYENLPHATILNTSLLLKYLFTENLTWDSKVTYSREDKTTVKAIYH